MVENDSSIEIDGRFYPLEVHRTMKATSSVRIRNGRVVMKLSRFLTGHKRDEVEAKFLKWARKRLEKVRTDFVLPNYEDGGRVVTHNRVYEIEIERRDVKSVRARLVDGFLIKISVPIIAGKTLMMERVRFLVESIIIKDQLQYLREVLEELNVLYFHEKFNAVRLKRMNARFGSCSTKRNINIAFRLLFAPREVFRYVCVHELAHLKEMNHSKRFWKLVEEAMPDYKKQERWLKESGFVLG